MHTPSRFVVVGQMACDLVLLADDGPSAADAVPVRERRELLGGKGANQAVALRQLGGEVALIAVVGDDLRGRSAVDQAYADGVDVCGVARRGETALLVDVVGPHGNRRLFEHVPQDSLVTPQDVRAAGRHFRHAQAVLLQLQQPADAVLTAARLGRENDALVAADGGMKAPLRDALLPLLHALRADASEAEQLVGKPMRNADDAHRAADRLLESGPAVVAVGVPDVGDLVAWTGGRRLFPFGDAPVVDPTGAGDAFFAALVEALVSGIGPEAAGRRAAAAAAATVSRVGGRPDLRGVLEG